MAEEITMTVPVGDRLERQNRRVQRRGPAYSAREEAEMQGGDEDVAFVGDDRLVRRRRRADDKFYINTRIIPPGFSYEWKREEVYGQPDLDHQVNLRENQWTPVPASRHPEMMPTGHDGPIRKNGMILMERPQYLTDEAREEDFQIALDQVRGKEREAGLTPSGHFTRDHPSVHRISKMRRSYGPVDAES